MPLHIIFFGSGFFHPEKNWVSVDGCLSVCPAAQRQLGKAPARPRPSWVSTVWIMDGGLSQTLNVFPVSLKKHVSRRCGIFAKVRIFQCLKGHSHLSWLNVRPVWTQSHFLPLEKRDKTILVGGWILVIEKAPGHFHSTVNKVTWWPLHLW